MVQKGELVHAGSIIVEFSEAVSFGGLLLRVDKGRDPSCIPLHAVDGCLGVRSNNVQARDMVRNGLTRHESKEDAHAEEQMVWTRAAKRSSRRRGQEQHISEKKKVLPDSRRRKEELSEIAFLLQTLESVRVIDPVVFIRAKGECGRRVAIHFECAATGLLDGGREGPLAHTPPAALAQVRGIAHTRSGFITPIVLTRYFAKVWLHVHLDADVMFSRVRIR